MTVPVKAVGAARSAYYRGSMTDAIRAAMDPALGPDRLVVASEIVQEIVLWLWTSAPVEKVWQREEIADAVRARFGA